MLWKTNTDTNFCLKYCVVRRVLIVLVALSALVAQINDLNFLKQRIFTKTLTEVTNAC